MTPEDRNTVTQRGSLTPERFAQVRAIFEAAVERPAAERRAYAAGACAGDAALLREVEAMLAADQVLDGPATPSSAPEEGRFPAGTVLAGRYRILGLLGRGGMGEVYKAFDLILNQTVALKFLAAKNLGEAALVRFRNEVRIARQVSHPNVCRVYDLGMVEGLHFLSMEYIDGEDLASLLSKAHRQAPARQGHRVHAQDLRGTLGRPRARRAASRSETRQHHDRRPRPASHHRFRVGRLSRRNPVKRSTQHRRKLLGNFIVGRTEVAQALVQARSRLFSTLGLASTGAETSLGAAGTRPAPRLLAFS